MRLTLCATFATLALQGSAWGEVLTAQQTADRLVDALNQLDSAAAEALFATSVKEHGPPRLADISGAPPTSGYARASFAQGVETLKGVLSSPTITVERPIVGGSDFAIFFHIAGILRTPIFGLGNNGQRIELSGADSFRIDRGQIVEHWTQTDHFGLVRGLTGPTLNVDDSRRSVVEVLKTFSAGTLPDSIVAADGDAVLVTELFRGAIVRVDAAGVTTTVAQLEPQDPSAPGFISLARNGDDIYASYMTRNDAGIWQLSKKRSGKLVSLPKGASPNGLAFDGHGGLIVGDNLGGLWRVKLADRTVARWLEHPLLSRRIYFGTYPAANGVQRMADTLFVANSDKGKLITIPILADGSPGVPKVLADDIPGDDLAVAADGTVYVTTHPFNSVIEVRPDGRRTAIAGSADGIVGSAAAMLRDDRRGRFLYVVTDGGAYAPVPGVTAQPGIFKIRLDSK